MSDNDRRHNAQHAEGPPRRGKCIATRPARKQASTKSRGSGKRSAPTQPCMQKNAKPQKQTVQRVSSSSQLPPYPSPLPLVQRGHFNLLSSSQLQFRFRRALPVKRRGRQTHPSVVVRREKYIEVDTTSSGEHMWNMIHCMSAESCPKPVPRMARTARLELATSAIIHG